MQTDHFSPARDGLDTRQAAAYIDRSPSYLEKARLGGRGPAYYRVARKIRYRPEDLDAWVEAQRVVPAKVA